MDSTLISAFVHLSFWIFQHYRGWSIRLNGLDTIIAEKSNLEVVSRKRNANKNVLIVLQLSTGRDGRKFVTSVLIIQRGYRTLTLEMAGIHLTCSSGFDHSDCEWWNTCWQYLPYKHSSL